MRRDEVVALLRHLEALQALIRSVEDALDDLSECEREIIGNFYINPVPGVSNKICEKFCIEQSSVYRRRDKALVKLGKTIPDLREFSGKISGKRAGTI